MERSETILFCESASDVRAVSQTLECARLLDEYVEVIEVAGGPLRIAALAGRLCHMIAPRIGLVVSEDHHDRQILGDLSLEIFSMTSLESLVRWVAEGGAVGD